MKLHNAASLLLLPLLFSACQGGPPSITHPPLDPTLDEPAPRSLVTSMNINPDPDAGPESSALYIVNPETGDLHVHPFSTMRGGPVPGQGMHTALTTDRETVFCTMGGNEDLDLRLVTIDLHWQNGHPHPEVLEVQSLVKAGTKGNESNGASCHPGGPGIRQEGHGSRITEDGRFLLFSEMQNDRIRVFDIQEGAFTSEPQTHPTLYAPHGLYPNPSGTHAATPQYWFDHHTVGIWTLDSLTGSPSFGFAIQMADSGGTGAYQHTVRWLDDSRFYVTVTQEATQGNGTSQQGIWMGNLATRSAVQVLDASDILEGVSDCGIAGSKLYVAEGNVAKFLAGEATPGHLSIWDITSPESPTLIRRLSAGSGFPDDFANAHSIGIPIDGSSVFVESFSSHYLIQVDPTTNEVVRTYGRADGLDTPHGIYVQP